MTLENTGPISLGPSVGGDPNRSIADEFGSAIVGGPWPLQDYYRSANIDDTNPLVPQWTEGNGGIIPTSGQIGILAFRGAGRIFPKDDSVDSISETSIVGGAFVGYTFEQDGDISRLGQSIDLGNWVTNPSLTVGDDFQILFTSNFGATPNVRRGADTLGFGQWITMDQTISVFFPIPSSPATLSGSFNFRIRRLGSSSSTGIFTSNSKSITVTNNSSVTANWPQNVFFGSLVPTSNARIEFNSDGTGLASQGVDNPNSQFAWLASGNANQYEIRLNKTSGSADVTGPANNAWHNMSTQRRWSVERNSAGSESAVTTIEIRLASTLQVLVSRQTTLTAQVGA